MRVAIGRSGILLLAAAASAALLGGCQEAGDGVGLDESGRVIPFCTSHPQDPVCVVIDPCIANPSAPGCSVDTCKSNPKAPGCSTDVCITNPQDPSCVAPKKSFATHILPIIRNNCQTCHTGNGLGATGGKLTLKDDSAYVNMVNKPAYHIAAGGFVRVKPFSPDSSVLYVKVFMATPKLPNNRTIGYQMPYQLPPLSASDIDLIKQWILDGAEP